MATDRSATFAILHLPSSSTFLSVDRNPGTVDNHFDWQNQLSVHCPFCDADFPAAKSMRGGYANCPRCNRAVQVGGGYEPLFWVLCGLGAAFVLGISTLLFFVVGPVAGGVAFLIGAAIMGTIIAAS